MAEIEALQDNHVEGSEGPNFAESRGVPGNQDNEGCRLGLAPSSRWIVARNFGHSTTGIVSERVAVPGSPNAFWEACEWVGPRNKRSKKKLTDSFLSLQCSILSSIEACNSAFQLGKCYSHEGWSKIVDTHKRKPSL